MKRGAKLAMRSLAYFYIIVGVCYLGYQGVSYLC